MRRLLPVLCLAALLPGTAGHGRAASNRVYPKAFRFPQLRESRAQTGLDTLASPPNADRKFITISQASLPTFRSFFPATPAVAAGPEHLFSLATSVARITSLDGTLNTQVDAEAFFNSPTGPVFAGRAFFDPRTGRFYVASVTADTQLKRSRLLVAVSQSADPTGTWVTYTFDSARVLRGLTSVGTRLAMGYDDHAIYCALDLFELDGPSPQVARERLMILDRNLLESGQPVAPVIVDDIELPDGGPALGLRPAQALDPLETCLFLAANSGRGLALYRIDQPLVDPALVASRIDTPDFALPGRLQQRTGRQSMQTVDSRPQQTCFRRGELWTCHHVSATGVENGPAAVVMYRISLAGAGRLLDREVLSDSSLQFAFPSLVPDASGNAMLMAATGSVGYPISMVHALYNGVTGALEPLEFTDIGNQEYTVTSRWGEYTDACPDASRPDRVWFQAQMAQSTQRWHLIAARLNSTPPLAPAPPADLRATSITSTQVRLEWRDDASNETEFVIERRILEEPFHEVARVPENVTVFTDLPLLPELSIEYRVRATNDGGSSAGSNTVQVRTLPGPLSFEPQILRAGVVPVGEVRRITGRVRNQTGHLLRIRLRAVGEGFRLDGLERLIVLPGSRAAFTVRFSPKVATEARGGLRVSFDDRRLEPAELPLRGTGR